MIIMFEIKNLYKTYTSRSGQSVTVLKNINLNIGKGKITAIVGPSGSGKSTLSKCLSLLEQPISGELWLNQTNLMTLNAQELRLQRQHIGLVFQSSALLKRRTTAENIALPLEFLGVVDAQIQQRVQSLLDNVGLSERAQHYPAQLSGGQQQRVGIARALALNPSIVIADEATSGLDPDSTQTILNLFTRLRDELGLSIILITHEMDVVRQIADDVAVLSHGEITEQGSVLDLVLNPNSEIGQKILPLARPHNIPTTHQALEVIFSSQHGTPLDWFSQLSFKLHYPIEIHASIVEDIHQSTVGKSIISLPQLLWQTQSSFIQQLFKDWNIGYRVFNHETTPRQFSNQAA